jgi:hypothetical protein
MIWLYWETQDKNKIINLSEATLLMIIPSCSFFIFFPMLLKFNITFTFSMLISVFLTAICYFIFIYILQKLGFQSF